LSPYLTTHRIPRLESPSHPHHPALLFSTQNPSPLYSRCQIRYISAHLFGLELNMTWLLLIAGVVLLVIRADLLVEGAARLAANFGVPSLVIDLTVVAFDTSVPEVAVSAK